MPCGGCKIIIVQIIFSGPLGLLSSFLVFENRVPLKTVLGGVAGVAHLNRLNKTEFAIFIYLMWSLFPKDLTNQNLLIK